MRIYAFIFISLAACSRDAGPRPVTILAASSLEETLREIAGEWSKQTGTPVRLRFAASSTLARQILEGAPADAFVSAAPEWTDAVRPIQQFRWLSNRLVCVVPRDAPVFDLKNVKTLALADEAVPAGRYARAALTRLGVTPARVVYGENARDVLSKVSHGGATAGVVYATDAPIDPAVRIAFSFPEESHPPIIITAGLLTPQGRAFFDILREPWAMEIARRHGFL